MKRLYKNTALLLLVLACASCAPKLRSTITNPQDPLSYGEFVLVLKLDDPFENDGIMIGTVRVSDNGFSANCSYHEVIEHLKSEARQNGGNLIKIIEHKAPDLYSSCNRITAEVYLVPDYRKHEREIFWSDNRQLTWDDFKGQPRETADSKSGAESLCGFGFESSYITPFARTKIFIAASFDCTKSWVREDQKQNDDLLAHEQFHFNISELYARKLRKAFIDADINSSNIKKLAQPIFDEVYAEHVRRQEQYDSETAHGINEAKQQEWQTQVDKELADLRAYMQ